MRHATALCGFFCGLSLITLFGVASNMDKKEATNMYRHVVMFKFKTEATAEQINDIVARFRELPSKIDTIIDYEDGVDCSPEQKSKGMTHCFLVTFKDKAGLEAYLPHAAHQDFVTHLLPILDDVMVLDYVTK
jgi:hypothetical protein